MKKVRKAVAEGPEGKRGGGRWEDPGGVKRSWGRRTRMEDARVVRV